MFRQDFKNFQLNTFDGTVFIVQNINGCIDRPERRRSRPEQFPGREFHPAVIRLRAVNLNRRDRRVPGDVGYGVRSHGVELEGSIRPMRDLHSMLGLTYANTKYRKNLVGNDNGAPLNPALRMLPGNDISNAPESSVTGVAGLDAAIGGSGPERPVLRRWAHIGDYNTGSDLFPQKEQDSLCGRQRPHRHPRPGRALVDRSCGRRTCSTRTMRRSRSTRRSRQVARRAAVRAGLHLAPFVDPQYPGRPAALLAVPGRAEDVRRDAARQARLRARPRRRRYRRRRRRRRRLRRRRPARTVR